MFVVKLVWCYLIFLTFACLESFLLLHQFWTRSFPGPVIFVDFFPFSILNMYCHYLLACRVSPERSAVKHMGFPLYATCCFSLVAFNSLGWMHETSAQGWCTRMTQRDWMGREVGGGFRMGNTCKSMADSCQCMAKPTTIL